MGLRGYILVKLRKPLDTDGLWELTEKYESIDEVEFASHVIGEYDFVLSVDTGKSLESIIENVRTLNPSSEVLGLKINNNYDKHREIRDLKIFDDLTRY
jgi:hypothetical protein